MQQQLRIWLCVCVFFGIYIRATKNTSSNNSTHLIVVGSAICWTTKQQSNRTYYFQCCYNYFLWCGTCVTFVASIYWYSYPPDIRFNWIASTILFTSRFLTNLLILMETFWEKQQHDTFLILLQEIEDSLRLRLRWDTQRPLLLRHLQRFLIYQIALSLIGTVPSMAASFIFVNYGGYLWRGLWFICAIRVRTLQLLVYLYVLHHYLEGLCKKLHQIVAFRMAPSRQLLDVDYGKLGTLEYFIAAREIYTLLYKAFRLLNDFAGWSLFGIVISYMLDISSNFYWLLLSFDDAQNRRFYYWADLWWFLPVISCVGYLCYWCNCCKQLDRTVAHLLSKIITRSSSRSAAHYRLVLHDFSMQLQLQHIEVTSKNMFVIDVPFIMSICTAMAMHLVILKQF
ncbi:putative gustatory receptor 39b [Anastrepha ludens]|uniref:putative gustatory receptor 39b n=1 Tax=Anastrepha ludens TaxID=28586 RepID=UPI0023B0BF35|nr:putative gustatory receptor 39b [Anastrepha ludens]